MTLTGNTVGERLSSTTGQWAVPWMTVVPFALVTGGAAGFWVVSMRGAVGSIERAGPPFTAWWQETALLLPVFVAAVLGALMLALRWFGPRVSRPRAVLVTSLLVVAFGTVAGVAELVVSSAYDYHLQSAHLAHMSVLHDGCDAACLTRERQDTLGLHLRAVAWGGALLLVTNTVLVGWVVALRGGRLVVARRPREPVPPAPGGQRRRDDLRLLLAAALVGSALVHDAVAPEHLSEWRAAGAFFLALAALEVGAAAVVIAGPRRLAMRLAVAVSVVPIGVWLWSRTLGLPFGPEAGVPEPVGPADSAAVLLEVGALVAALLLVRGGSWLRQPSPGAHGRALALVLVVAVAAIGCGGSVLTVGDGHHAGTDTAEVTARCWCTPARAT